MRVFIASHPMTTSIRLEPLMDQRLAQLALSTGRSKAFYLRELIANGMDDLEYYYSASVVMERVRKGQEQVLSTEQVRRDLGLDD